MTPLPRILIITPSYNQAAYLEEAMDSILAQGYPHLCYAVMDGGSSDDSVKVIQKFQHHLAFWVSRKDGGQADALNQGFARGLAEGPADLVAYLNSDDVYSPGTLACVADHWQRLHADSGWRDRRLDDTWLVGDVENFGSLEGTDYTPLTSYQEERAIADRWFWFYANPVHQPGSFWSADLQRRMGPFDVGLRYAFDYDLFMKFRFWGQARPAYVRQTLARFRLHQQSKTVSQRPRFDAEFALVRKRIAAKLPGTERMQMERYVRHTRADRLQAGALAHGRDGHKTRALGELARSLWEDPRLIWQRRTLGALKRVLRPAPP